MMFVHHCKYWPRKIILVDAEVFGGWGLILDIRCIPFLCDKWYTTYIIIIGGVEISKFGHLRKREEMNQKWAKN